MALSLEDELLGMVGGDEAEEGGADGETEDDEGSEDAVAMSDDDDDDDDTDEDDDDGSDDEELAGAMPLKKRSKVESHQAKADKASAGKAGGAGDGADSDGSFEFNYEDYEDGYDSDLMGDAEDRAKMQAMTELDREMVLFDRQERRDELRRQKEIALEEKAEHDAKRAAKAQKKRGTARHAGRQSEKSRRRSALDELVAKRDGRKGIRSRTQYRDDDDEDFTEDDEQTADEETDDEYDRSGQQKYRRGRRAQGSGLEEGEYGEDENYKAEWSDIKTVQVKRTLLKMWHDKPFFADVMPGQFVRLAIGSRTDVHTGQQKSVYRMAQVQSVESRKEGKYVIFKDDLKKIKSPYRIDGQDASSMTDQWLKITIGAEKATFPMSLVSNADLTEEEFERYCEVLDEGGQGRPMIRDKRENERSLKYGKEFKFTEEEVKKTLLQKDQSGKRKYVNYAVDKERLKSMLARAEDEGDEDAITTAKERMNEMEEYYRSVQHARPFAPPPSHPPTPHPHARPCALNHASH